MIVNTSGVLLETSLCTIMHCGSIVYVVYHQNHRCVYEHALWLSSLHTIVFMVIYLLVVAVVYSWKHAYPLESRVAI